MSKSIFGNILDRAQQPFLICKITFIIGRLQQLNTNERKYVSRETF